MECPHLLMKELLPLKILVKIWLRASDESQPYTVERIMRRTGKILPNKRVICDIGFVIRELDVHAKSFDIFAYSGLGATLLFKCSNFLCSKISKLHSDQAVEPISSSRSIIHR
ncbi:hypothetical protein TNCV_4345051 [Trichonephila clavipes]|nr:hypothetical protein TNCV_4345051 [Trichonephila clavipes]